MACAGQTVYMIEQLDHEQEELTLFLQGTTAKPPTLVNAKSNATLLGGQAAPQ